ncbi:MAG: DNA modification methylase [Planctomycetota bacterium]
MSTSELHVEIVPLDRLFPSPSNPRRNDDAVQHVAASIRRFGFQQPLVAKPSGEVIAGNTRWKAAKSLGLPTVPVVWFTGSDLDAVAFCIADNKTATFATFDDEALSKLLAKLREEDALEGVGFTDEDIDRLIAELDEETKEVGDDEPVEAPETPTTQRGDLWILGGHRLLCGDSTNENDVARLMAGERAVLFATDPPYLVDYQGGNHPQSTVNKPDVKDKHWDDYLDPETSVEFFATFLRVALRHCIERVPVYQWHATRRQALVEQAWQQNGLLVHQTIVWAKARGVLTHSHFLWSHEPAFYGWPEGSMPDKDRRPDPGDRTVWEIDQQGQHDGIHPTQKPLEIFERPIRYHTRRGEVVLEPFSGSGSQIIAAERHGRRCFAMELSPAFVDAALQRWQKATGKPATLDGDGRTFEQIAAERSAT